MSPIDNDVWGAALDDLRVLRNDLALLSEKVDESLELSNKVRDNIQQTILQMQDALDESHLKE